MKVCIVVSNFYPKISSMLVRGSVLELKKNNIKNPKIITVPGTFEIPVVISSKIKKYDAFIVLGCVIKGQTPHFHYICSTVINSLVNLSLKFNKPIGNGILTCNNKKQAITRANPNLKDKGGDAAKAAISLYKVIK